MSISSTDIVWRRSAVMDVLSPANGGRMTPTPIPSGVKNAIWPDVPHSERVAGSTKHMKVHIHVANEDSLRLIQPRVFVERHTPGDDAIVIFSGTHTDNQSGVSPSRVYGAGGLNNSVLTGATTIEVMTEGAALDYFKPGDLLRVSNKPSITSPIGNVQYVRIAGGGVSYAGDVATLSLESALSYDFSAADTRVASVVEPADIVGTFDNVVLTSGSGNFDHATFPILVNSVGGVFDEWTITFTNATTFNCVGANSGAVGSGNISSNFSPANPAFARPFFSVDRDAWGGSFVAGNTLVFRTLPASFPLWYRRVIPANAASLSGNNCVIGIDGESE
jgi:hypothetical protein